MRQVVRVVLKDVLSLGASARMEELDMDQRETQRFVDSMRLNEALGCVVVVLRPGCQYLLDRKMPAGELWVPLSRVSYVLVVDEQPITAATGQAVTDEQVRPKKTPPKVGAA
jgi:hypothetical protein